MTLLDNVVRATNGLVLVLGLTLCAYGGYVIGVCKLATVAEAALALGVLDVLLGLVAISCYRTLFALRLYGLVMTFLVVAEFVLAVLFLTNSPSVTGQTTCGNDQALSYANAKAALPWIILAVAAFQSVSLFFVFVQVCSVDKVRRRLLAGCRCDPPSPWPRARQLTLTPPPLSFPAPSRPSPLTRASTRRRRSWAALTSTARCRTRACPARRTATSRSTPPSTQSTGSSRAPRGREPLLAISARQGKKC